MKSLLGRSLMIKFKFSIVYSWFVRSVTYFFPNHPIFMRFRGWLYSFMMQECGSNFQVAATVIFNSLSGMRVGDNVYVAPGNVFIVTDIRIEDDVLIGPNSVFSGGNHQFDGKSFRYEPSLVLGPLIINRGSWIAANCTVTSGAVLPPMSILAAGAVLTRKMTDKKMVYAGIPAKPICPIKELDNGKI